MALDLSAAWAHGACLCGKIKYSLTKIPKDIGRYICHCVLCKKASGSAFMTNWWMTEDAVAVTAGKDALKKVVITDTASSNHVTRSFCGECGSPLFLRSTNPICDGQIGVTAGTIDFDKTQPQQNNIALSWTPDGESFIEDRLVCISAVPGVKQFRGLG